MSFEEQPGFATTVADLNNYGKALNQCETVEEVVSLTIEAVSVLFEFPHTTVIEVGDGGGQVIQSTAPDRSVGDAPGEVAREAIETRETVAHGDSESGTPTGTTVAVPGTIVDDVVVVVVTGAPDGTALDEEQRWALEMLASHAATAIDNIRSHERLERARRDLEKRKEMVELYDRLLRHDLGNDLQVVASFAEKLATDLDGEDAEYAERIERTAKGSADLIHRVGDLVSTLEQQEEPTPQSLREVLLRVVEDATDQYGSLTVSMTPEAVDYRVYAGELLDSVFTNLVTNAAVHNEGDVHVDVAAEADGETVTVTVADDGRGIPERIADSLFEMGRKGPDSDGTGFGLGFVKALTESYGGDIAVGESDAGGAAFSVTLERA